jgi:hypothetical protein
VIHTAHEGTCTVTTSIKIYPVILRLSTQNTNKRNKNNKCFSNYFQNKRRKSSIATDGILIKVSVATVEDLTEHAQVGQLVPTVFIYVRAGIPACNLISWTTCGMEVLVPPCVYRVTIDQKEDIMEWITIHRKPGQQTITLGNAWPAAGFKPQYQGQLPKTERHKLAVRLTEAVTGERVGHATN